jgi:hypothetical protein
MLRASFRFLFLWIYLAAVIVTFLVYSFGLFFLGLPWSFLVMFLGWVIIHAGSRDALEWMLLLSTLPNIILLTRWAFLGYVKYTTQVD